MAAMCRNLWLSVGFSNRLLFGPAASCFGGEGMDFVYLNLRVQSTNAGSSRICSFDVCKDSQGGQKKAPSPRAMLTALTLRRLTCDDRKYPSFYTCLLDMAVVGVCTSLGQTDVAHGQVQNTALQVVISSCLTFHIAAPV